MDKHPQYRVLNLDSFMEMAKVDSDLPIIILASQSVDSIHVIASLFWQIDNNPTSWKMMPMLTVYVNDQLLTLVNRPEDEPGKFDYDVEMTILTYTVSPPVVEKTTVTYWDLSQLPIQHTGDSAICTEENLIVTRNHHIANVKAMSANDIVNVPIKSH